MSIIEVKVRKVGSSFGILLPKEVLVDKGIKEGETITVILPPKKNIKLLNKAFGMAKGAKPFIRDRNDRKL